MNDEREREKGDRFLKGLGPIGWGAMGSATIIGGLEGFLWWMGDEKERDEMTERMSLRWTKGGVGAGIKNNVLVTNSQLL